jgi:glutamyl-tRNA reductase
MNLLLLGLNHRVAPVQVRERLAVPPGRLTEALHALCSAPGIDEVALLSTCNRLEIYAVADDVTTGQCSLIDALAAYRDMDAREFSVHLYTHSGAEAARHLCRVAAGLDSLLVGEHQILGQVKLAFQAALDAGTAGAVLAALFRQALCAGKRARAETDIGLGARSLGQMSVSIAREALGDLARRTALLIGAGKIGKLAGRALVESGLRCVLVANRTFERAVELAQSLGGQAVHFDALPPGLVEADLVIAATGAPHVVLHETDVRQAISARSGRVLVVIDLAVPRNVDPAIRALPGVRLYDMDDLSAVVAQHHPIAAPAIAAAEEIALQSASDFLAWWHERQSVPLIRALRTEAESMRQAEVSKALRCLGSLTPEQQKTIDALSATLVNKLLYASIHAIKASS